MNSNLRAGGRSISAFAMSELHKNVFFLAGIKAIESGDQFLNGFFISPTSDSGTVKSVTVPVRSRNRNFLLKQ